MSRRRENENNSNNEVPNMFVLARDWFTEKSLPWSGKRATVFAIYYSFPSNQNAGGGTGTNVIVQKIIPWGENAEPRVYISPFALKRRIRDYWIKKGENVLIREDRNLFDDNIPVNLEYLDVDLFGFMKAKKGQNETAVVRPGPITTWGAVSLESLHSFVDFNTYIKSTGESKEGGSIINRSISTEYYFTSFHINPDLIGVDVTKENDEDIKKYLDKKEERLKLFFEALKYAMQKDSGGARDRPVCVLIGVAIGDRYYPSIDKDLFFNIEVNDKKIKIKKPELLKNDSEEKVYIIHYKEDYFDEETKQVFDREKEKIFGSEDDVINDLLTPESQNSGN